MRGRMATAALAFQLRHRHANSPAAALAPYPDDNSGHD
jgi:hypothetical protein